ncbi:hypothetical protein [Rhizobium sp. FKL33]|uniref:hypothetical protein n=1 Tax=Rhizobium sp. FKL33 TaxID=2562307 RepID=UPI0010BFEBEA|nr:hypothetical protein [Rhizobium sp. FKL33]
MTENNHRSGFDDFSDLLKRYGQTILWITGSSVVLPAAAYNVEILPPWPSGGVLITAILQLVVMAVIFQFTQLARRRVVTWAIGMAFILLVSLSFGYFYFLSTLTFTGGPARERQVKGFECSAEALSIPKYATKCPELTDQLIATASKADDLWTSQSITKARMLLLALWLAAYGFFSAILVLLITFQSTQRGRFLPG